LGIELINRLSQRACNDHCSSQPTTQENDGLQRKLALPFYDAILISIVRQGGGMFKERDAFSIANSSHYLMKKYDKTE